MPTDPTEPPAPAVEPANLRWGVLGAEHLPACIDLGRETFSVPEEALAAWFENRLHRNPWQSAAKGFGIGLWQEDRLMAFRAMFGQPWWLDGKETAVVFAAHTALNPELRGSGLGKELIRRSTECGDLTSSTSSGVVTQKIHAKFGFTCIGEDNDFYRARVSFQGALAKRFGPPGRWVGLVVDGLRGGRRSSDVSADLAFRPVSRCDERFDDLWVRARGGYLSCLQRTSTYLNWRLFDAPTCTLYMGGLFEEGGEGRLRAFAVWHVQRLDEYVQVAVLRDLFAEAEDDGARQSLVRALLGHWRSVGLSWASFEVAHPTVTELFRRLGFEHVPSKGGRYWVHSSQPLSEAVWEDWFRSGLDGDYLDLAGPQYD